MLRSTSVTPLHISSNCFQPYPTSLTVPFTPRLVTLHSIPYETRSERGEEAKVESRWTEWVSGEGRECDETRIWGSERGKDGKNLWDEPRNTRLTAQSSSVTHRSSRASLTTRHSPPSFVCSVRHFTWLGLISTNERRLRGTEWGTREETRNRLECDEMGRVPDPTHSTPVGDTGRRPPRSFPTVSSLVSPTGWVWEERGLPAYHLRHESPSVPSSSITRFPVGRSFRIPLITRSFSTSTPFRVILSGLSVPHSFRVAGVSGEERTEARGMRWGAKTRGMQRILMWSEAAVIVSRLFPTFTSQSSPLHRPKASVGRSMERWVANVERDEPNQSEWRNVDRRRCSGWTGL